MRNKASRSRLRLLAALAGLALLPTLGGVLPAEANTSNSITGSVNSSDPELIQCPNSAGNGWTLCLFTSQDMGTVSVPYGQNYYPMNQTMLWRLKDNTDASRPANWINQGPILKESSLYSAGVPSNAYHLWAPGVRYLGDSYFLYVPDVLDTGDESHSSRIFLFRSTNPSGATGYKYVGKVQTPSSPNNGYASDPNLFMEPTGDKGGQNNYLVYANGDNSNCGGLSMGLLDSTMTGFLSTPQQITINGFGSSGLGDCGAGHPYLEGPALYSWYEVGAPYELPFNYVLTFAAKPNAGNPSGCSSSNEVIAYATSWDVNGPYDYQGIIQCGSSTEWTDQASIVKHTANSKYLFAWHDGGGTVHNRRTHLMCVKWGSDGKIAQIPRSSANMSNC